MQTTIAGLALVLALGAAAAAGYVLSRDRADPADLEARLQAVETQVGRLERSLAASADGLADSVREGPSLVGRSPFPDLTPSGTTRAGRLEGTRAGVADGGPEDDASAEATAREIEDLVDKAVAKKAAQIQVMRDKKPPLATFAKTLELTEEQKRLVEREVLRAQREIQAILETPTAGGANFMDELVDVLADRMANPGRNPGRGMKLFGRLMSEEFPGTNQTYAERAEAVKATVRDAFRRDFTEEQYAAFRAWQMDPTEIKDVPYSPWKEVEGRVLERAREMGAEIPPRDG